MNNESQNLLNLPLYSLNILFKLHFVLVVKLEEIEKERMDEKTARKIPIC
jgi:hypothetical protein